MATNPLALMCPLLSQLKASPVKCRGRECAWWVAAGQICSVAAVAGFFHERRHYPNLSAAK